MTQEQYYFLVNGFSNDDWPFQADRQTIRDLNRILPPGYHFAVSASPDDGGNLVELYNYAGEISRSEANEVLE